MVYDPYKPIRKFDYAFDDEELIENFERRMRTFSLIFEEDIFSTTQISWAYAKGIVNGSSKTSKVLDEALAIFTDPSTWTWYKYGERHRNMIARNIIKKNNGFIPNIVKSLEKFLKYWNAGYFANRSYNIVKYAYLERL